MEESSTVSQLLEHLLPHQDDVVIENIQSLYAGIGQPTWRAYAHQVQYLHDLSHVEDKTSAQNPYSEVATTAQVRDYYLQLRSQALAGNADAINDLGWHFLNGFGLAYEPVLAGKLLTIAAAEGALMARFNLGQQAYYGKGMAVDVVLAAQYYEQALEDAHPWAALALGRLYDTQGSEDEHDLPSDQARAVDYYQQAAEWKLYEAGFYLGQMFLKRDSKHYNLADALYWLQWSATHGCSFSSEALARYYVEDCFLDFPREAAQALYCFWRDFSIRQNGYESEQWLALDEAIEVPHSNCLELCD